MFIAGCSSLFWAELMRRRSCRLPLQCISILFFFAHFIQLKHCLAFLPILIWTTSFQDISFEHNSRYFIWTQYQCDKKYIYAGDEYCKNYCPFPSPTTIKLPRGNEPENRQILSSSTQISRQRLVDLRLTKDLLSSLLNGQIRK